MKYSLIQEGKDGSIVIVARQDDAKPDSYPLVIALLPPDQMATAELIRSFLETSPEATKAITGQP